MSSKSFCLDHSNAEVIKHTFSFLAIRTKEDLEKREAVVASKRYFDPILFKHAF